MPQLLTGTVTFVFTDVEGSTRLVKELHGRYGEVLEDQLRLLREAVAAHSGEEVDRQGDGCLFAFRRADAAVAAAVAGQRAIAKHDWPGSAAIRVRMGIHTAEPEVFAEGYYGVGVNRAARIMAAGHGGQILLSRAASTVLEDADLAGAVLRDLGEHLLKDLDRPERIYQIEAEGLPSEFPPLRTGTPGPMDSGDVLARGREAYESRRWLDAYECLLRADRTSPLAPVDLERLMTSTAMVGRMDEYNALLERAHHAFLDAGEALVAARCAGWLGMNLALRGDVGQAGGWFGRAQRLVDGEGRDCVERGYLLLPAVFRAHSSGNHEAAAATAAEAVATADRFRDPDLFALAMHLQGMARIEGGHVEQGLAMLDEAMVPLTAGEVSPIVAGIVYCGVIGLCEYAFEPRRAREWTSALTRWCAEQPQMVAFTGRCLAHRAGIMQLDGQWGDALEEARLARERCEQAMNVPAAGQAFYQQAEVYRLQGNFEAAEAAYREANRFGREPQPGLALLRLAQGDLDAAAAAIRRALDEATVALRRAALLPAYVEVMLAADEAQSARAACAELTAISGGIESALLRAIAAHARGAVELAGADARAALASLRQAWRLWHELEAPYESARTRVLVGLACQRLGDEDTATLELEAARAIFEGLGAAPDLARLDSLTERGARPNRHGLTARELEVLRLVAAGKSNKEIAGALVVSEHTVARHLQNIFRKLDVTSRTAASAFAFEHDLV
jgi:class 3 adenylate cyclase/DNA-binding CsgD family transcriptional regulator